MINFTLPEIRRLLVHLILRHAPEPDHVWSWSRWRRRRQHQARVSHYRTRGYPPISAVAVLVDGTVEPALAGCRLDRF